MAERRWLIVCLCWLFLDQFVSKSRAQQTSTKVVAILAVDFRSNINGVRINYDLTKGFFDFFRLSGLNVEVRTLNPNAVSAAALLNAVRSLDPADVSDQTVVVYYAGHGGTDQRFGHFLNSGGGELLRSTLVHELRLKNPRLAVVLTDGCSSSATAAALPVPALGEHSIDMFRDLFFKHKGLVDITAASYQPGQPGEYAFYDPGLGGIFTHSLLATFSEFQLPGEGPQQDHFYSWAERFVKLKNEMDAEFRNFKEAVRFRQYALNRVDLGRLNNQATQTPQQFGLGLRFGDPRDFRFNNPGPHLRFGAMVYENTKDGVVVGRVVPGMPADHVTVFDPAVSPGTFRRRVAPLLKGDIIQSVNGIRIRSVEDFYNALNEVRPGGEVRFSGQDASSNWRRSYKAAVNLDN